MAAAPRARPDDFFSPEAWATLTARSPTRGLWLVAHCWAVIGAAMAVGAVWPLTVPLMVLVVGARQLGLFVLMHDAAHGLLHPDRRINDFVGQAFCSSSLHAYRPYHLQHHRYVQQTEDPDLVLSAPFPITRASLRRKLLRDLTGQTFVKQRFGHIASRLARRTPEESAVRLFMQELAKDRRFLIGNALAFALFALGGIGWVWLTLWLMPMMTWLPLVSRVRNIAEHALIAENEADPLRQARTTNANWVERALVAPYWVNYHAEHHLFTGVPCWKLRAAHRALQDRGVTARMATQPGYVPLLRLAASR